MSNIPSEEDFARAHRLDRARRLHLSTIAQNLLGHFENSCRLHDVALMPQEDNTFLAAIFFQTVADLTDATRRGYPQQMIDFIYAELERYGRGAREDIQVHFEFDSDQNVQRVFGGDYRDRLN